MSAIGGASVCPVSVDRSEDLSLPSSQSVQAVRSCMGVGKQRRSEGNSIRSDPGSKAGGVRASISM